MIADYKKYTFEEIEIGHEESFSVTITEEMEDAFRNIVGDINPLHRSDEYAKDMGFSKHVSFGMLTASLLSTLAGVYLPGKYSLIHSVEVGFLKPVFAGDELKIMGVVEDKEEFLNLLHLKVKIKNQNGKVVLKGKMKVLVMNREISKID